MALRDLPRESGFPDASSAAAAAATTTADRTATDKGGDNDVVSGDNATDEGSDCSVATSGAAAGKVGGQGSRGGRVGIGFPSRLDQLWAGVPLGAPADRD